MPLPSSETGRDVRARAVFCITVLTLFLLLGAGPATWAASGGEQLSAEQTARFAGQAEAWRAQLSERVMPFWYDRTIDPENGGYLLLDAGTSDKLLVSQARLMWGFAHAHRMGIEDPERDYLAAAANGYRFLRANFLDPEHGGYYWMTNRAGRPLDQRKYLYGQACVIYGLVEYYRASGEVAALQDAIDLYRTVMERAHDPVHGGWGEHFEADWRPILDPETLLDIGLSGYRSGEALLQWMEALTELDLVSQEAAADQPAAAGIKVEDALAEALDLNLTYFFPQRPGEAYPYRQPDWQRPLGAKFKEISYGHNVEFAWQMLAAQAALGREPLWQRFDAILQHALQHGFDHERGGLYAIGFGDRPALATEKVWWAQAEMLVALTIGVNHSADPDRVQALDQLLSFLTSHQIDPQDGIWFDAVEADGSPWRPVKAHHWKTSYHDERALVKFIEAFDAG